MQAYHEPNELKKVTQNLLEILNSYYHEPEKSKAIEFHSKEELIEAFYEATPPDVPSDFNTVLDEFKTQILPASVKTWHPLFMNQMFAGASFPSILGDLLASMMNPTLATWEMSPVATIIEKNVAQWMASLIGLPKGSWGIFLPGGSLSNLLALTVARNHVLGIETREKGIEASSKPTLICSKASHYSVANAANILGIGTDNLILIDTLPNGSMDIRDLEAQLERCDQDGRRPFAIVATMGLTVTGCFDPLADIVRICKPRGIHVHVDAAFGGGMAMTEYGKTLFQGIKEADTVTWDAHKTMHMPLTSSVLLMPDPEKLKPVFSQQASYLFHPQDPHEIEDLGKYTPLCGKRFDALKLWLVWKTYGTSYFKDLAEDRFKLVQDFNKYIEEADDLDLDYKSQSPIACFRWVAPAWKTQSRTDYASTSNALHRHIREAMKQSGNAFFNITNVNGLDQFRMILINPLTELEPLIDLVQSIRKMANDYLKEHAS